MYRKSFKNLFLSALALITLCGAGNGGILPIIHDNCLNLPKTADCAAMPQEGSHAAHNVILLVGDGMGVNQIVAGRTFVNGPAKPFDWEELPNRGLVTTCSLSGITDSAASGTAMATGSKTENGVISMTPGRDPQTVPNIADLFGDKKSIGIVSTTSIWDATPAVFVSHATQRSKSSEIAYQMVTHSKPRLILGGGAKAFGLADYLNGGADKENPAKAAVDGGYRLVTTREQLLALDPAAAGPTLGLFAGNALEFEASRDQDTTEPHLSDLAAYALKNLATDPRGFFVMIEGARIDHACHSTSAEKLVHEMAEFHKTVTLVLDWAKPRGDTLVIITADHETGNTEIVPGDYEQGGLVKIRWWGRDLPWHANHSTQRVPVFAFGPYASAVSEHLDNTQIFCLIKNAFGP